MKFLQYSYLLSLSIFSVFPDDNTEFMQVLCKSYKSYNTRKKLKLFRNKKWMNIKWKWSCVKWINKRGEQYVVVSTIFTFIQELHGTCLITLHGILQCLYRHVKRRFILNLVIQIS